MVAGSGVTFGLPLMLDIVRRARSVELGCPDIAVTTERLTFVWVIRDASSVEWIAPQLHEALKLAPAGLLRIHIYCTRGPAASIEQDPDTDSIKMSKITPNLSARRSIDESINVPLVLRYGRPDFQAIIKEEIAASGYSDWVAIGTCGPAAMTAQLANTAAGCIQPSAVLRGEHRRNVSC